MYLCAASNESKIRHITFQDHVNIAGSSTSKYKHRRSLTVYFTEKLLNNYHITDKHELISWRNPYDQLKIPHFGIDRM